MDTETPLQLPYAPTGSGDCGRVAVVLVNWNGWQDTLDAVSSLNGSSYSDWEAIVVENGSVDDSVARLREQSSQFILVESATNLGFAGACNLGVTIAKERGAAYVYFLNNDAKVETDTLEMLVQTSKTLAHSAVLGSVVRFETHGGLQFWGSRRSNLGLPDRWPASEDLFAAAPDLIESDFIMGASLFVPMPVMEAVGPFDDRFFLNYEETDWCYRAVRDGYPCLVVKNALVIHKSGAALGSPAGPLQVYFMRRNALLLAEKHCSPPQFATLYVRQFISVFTRMAQATVRERDDHRISKVASRANALATLDYTLRRFGDCPPVIRKMADEYRTSH